MREIDGGWAFLKTRKYQVSPHTSTLSAKVARREATCCAQSTSVTNEPFIRHTYQVPSTYTTRARALTHKHAWTHMMGMFVYIFKCLLHYLVYSTLLPETRLHDLLRCLHYLLRCLHD